MWRNTQVKRIRVRLECSMVISGKITALQSAWLEELALG